MRPPSIENVAVVTRRPASGASFARGARRRVHAPGSGRGPATNRRAEPAGGAASASPQTISSRPPSCSKAASSQVGGAAASSRAITVTARSSRRSFGSTSGSSRVRIESVVRSAPNVKLRSPPAACAVVQRHGISATASRGRSSSNHTRSSNRSTTSDSVVRSKSRIDPATASADVWAAYSTVAPSGASIRWASPSTASGASIRM